MKKFLCALLAIVMVMSILPSVALALEEQSPDSDEAVVTVDDEGWHDCTAETDAHDEFCLPHDEQFWDDDFPDNIYGEFCPSHQEPSYTDISERIDELPWLDDVMEMDAESVLEVNRTVYVIRDMIVAALDSEVCNCFDLELGEARIEKYNALFEYTDEYIRNQIAPNRRRSAGATRIDVGAGRVEVTATNVRILGLTSSTLIRTLPHNPAGYLLHGTYTRTISSGGILSWRTVRVMPDVATTLYFENLTITNTNSVSQNTSYDMQFICVDVTGSDTTIILMDGTTNVLTGGIREGGGALVKDNATDGRTLTIACERWDEPGHMCTGTETGNLPPGSCGRLEAIGFAYHSAAIGSSRDAVMMHDTGGFGNLYIRGGIIVARNRYVGDSHVPGIGSMCGTAFIRNRALSFANAQMFAGKISRDIHISGGRVFAYGGGNCSGIGSGIGGPVNGIYISGGAYVYARGGQNSPGIGSGGGADLPPEYTASNGMRAPSYNVSNIIISGGRTVVEAEGSNTVQSPIHSSVAGIGSGISRTGSTGIVTNVQARPEPDWLALVRAGTSKQDASYIGGTPSAVNIDILPDMYYTLVHFSGLKKTASVNGGPNKTGSAEAMIRVEVGNRIRYTIDTASWASETNSSYTLTDAIPRGMTLVTEAGSFYPTDMTHGTTGGITTVRWENQTSAGEFFFTVTVDNTLTENETRTYINEAIMVTAIDQLEIPTNKTYHYTDRSIRYTTLTVSKEVTGDFGNKAMEFEFTIFFRDSAGAPLLPPTQFDYTITDLSGAAPADGTLILDDHGSARFRLAHGQAIRIADVPLGGTVQVIETEDGNYQTTFTDSEYADTIFNGNDTTLLLITENRSIHYVNYRVCVPPTGIGLDSTGAMLLLTTLVSLPALAVYVLATVYRRKKIC